MAEFFEGHISVVALWKYRSEKNPLSEEQTTHLYTCNDCLATLGLCQISDTIAFDHQAYPSVDWAGNEGFIPHFRR